MTRRLLHSCNVSIEFQGDDGLIYLGSTELSINYQIFGFDRKQITIHDFRKDTHKGLDKFWKTGNPELFHQLFCSTAYLELYQDKNSCLILELHSPQDNFDAEIALWIAVGIGNELPAYDYIFLESDTKDNKTFSILALYQYSPVDMVVQPTLQLDNHV